MPLFAARCLTQVFLGRTRGRIQLGLGLVSEHTLTLSLRAMWAGTSAGRIVNMAKKGVTPSGDDVSDVVETRALRHRDVGNEIAPAYPERLALSSHVKGLQFSPVLLE